MKRKIPVILIHPFLGDISDFLDIQTSYQQASVRGNRHYQLLPKKVKSFEENDNHLKYF